MKSFWFYLSDVYAFQAMYRERQIHVHRRRPAPATLHSRPRISTRKFLPQRYRNFLAAESAYVDLYFSPAGAGLPSAAASCPAPSGNTSATKTINLRENMLGVLLPAALPQPHGTNPGLAKATRTARHPGHRRWAGDRVTGDHPQRRQLSMSVDGAIALLTGLILVNYWISRSVLYPPLLFCGMWFP